MTRSAPQKRQARRDELSALREMNEALQERFNQLTDRFLNLSQEVAEQDYGQDRVLAALAALDTASPLIQSWVVQQPHPYGALIAWHRGAMN